MRRCFYLLPLLISSIALFSFGSNDLVYKNQILSTQPTTTPTLVQVEESDEIFLEEKVVCHPCPPGERPEPGFNCSDDMTIAISAIKPKNNQLKYEYTVSGGRVISEGAKVVWDLTNAQPGTYQIRVDIEDKSTKQKRAETETLMVLARGCGEDCLVCPTLTVDGMKSQTAAGDTITFTANVSGGNVADITYKWKASAGEIIEGQGTPVIIVAMNSKMAGKTVKATVEIEGVCDVCPKSESAEVIIAATKTVKKKN